MADVARGGRGRGMTQSLPSSDRAITGIGVGAVLADRFVVDAVLATVGMGAILRACDRLVDRAVAVKTLHPHLARTPDAERFFLEGQTVASLAHPNLIAIYDTGSA